MEREEIMRRIRDGLLHASDWSQMPDAPIAAEKKAEWVAYRQALRDLPENPSWPNVTFPTQPTK